MMKSTTLSRTSAYPPGMVPFKHPADDVKVSPCVPVGRVMNSHVTVRLTRHCEGLLNGDQDDHVDSENVPIRAP